MKTRVSRNGVLTTDISYDNKVLSSQLMELFEFELEEIYWAEKTLLEAIPTMVIKATSKKLIQALENHFKDTIRQVYRVEMIFDLIHKTATPKVCQAMAGLVDEAEEIMNECDEGAMRDAGIISAGQKIEHFEIASYGTLREFAYTLGLSNSAELLEESLNEEKKANDVLSKIAVDGVNIEAATIDGEGVEEIF